MPKDFNQSTSLESYLQLQWVYINTQRSSDPKGSLTGVGRLKAVVAMRQLTVSFFLCRWLWLKLEFESDLAELDVSVWCISNQFFEKQPDEICSHLSEKGSNGRVFFVPEKLENHTNEGKGKEKTKKRGGRKEEKRKKQWLHSYFL